jgi:aldose 1-epimerase
MTLRVFGRCGASEVLEVTLRAGHLEARIITWGAVLRDLVLAGQGPGQPLVLGLERLEEYLAYSPEFGAVVGRYANRIGDARFRLGGEEVMLVPNENGNGLHGGPAGFSRRIWSLVAHDERRAHLALVSEDGEMGFPGRLYAFATYELLPPATLRIALQAFADEPTPVNLTAHNYFNFDGSADARDHRLQLVADHRLATDAELIPTGDIVSVAGPAYDFRQERAVRPPEAGLRYDQTYVVRRDRADHPALVRAATLTSPVTRIAMEMWTTEIGLQLYDGHKVDVPVAGLRGARYGPHAGIALEPQRFPDAPNHAHFPACTLSPGDVSRQVTELRFRRLDG